MLYKDSRDNGDFDDIYCVGLEDKKKYQVSGWAAFTGLGSDRAGCFCGSRWPAVAADALGFCCDWADALRVLL